MFFNQYMPTTISIINENSHIYILIVLRPAGIFASDGLIIRANAV